MGCSKFTERIYRAFGAPDDPTGYGTALESLKTERDKLKALHVRTGVKDTRVRAWVETKNTAKKSIRFMSKVLNLGEISDDIKYTDPNGLFELVVNDNETANLNNGKLEFVGNATLNVKALSNEGGTLYVDMGDGDVFEYEIEVVEQHECSSDKWVTVIPALNGEEGYQACYCDVCDELIGFRASSECTNHKFSEWTTQTEATCLNNGTKSKSCSECGYSEFDFTPALGHTEETRNVSETTCTTDGYTGDVYCSVCNELLVEGEVVQAPGHSYCDVTYTWTADNSKCTAEHSCGVCGDKQTETVSTVANVTQNATCTLPELTTYTATFTENEAFAKQEKKDVETKAATGHSYGEVVYTWSADNGSCTVKRECSCGDRQSETVDSVANVTQNATCTLPELTTYTATFTTNEAFAKQEKKNVETKASLEHDFASKYTIDKNATCTENGSESRHCSRCSATTDSRPIVAKGHTYTDKVVPPTCATEGYTTHTCSVCGASSTDTKIPATGNHQDGNNDGKCDTCGKDLGTHTPTDPSASCDHICHKTGFVGFIYKIIRIFWKLFKTNKTCSCGVDHY